MPGAVDRHASGIAEPCGAARPVGASGRACQARQRRHDAAGRDFPDRVIVGVRDIQDAGAVDGNPPGLIESRGGASPIGTPGRTRQARQRGHDAAGRDPPDRVIVGVGDIHGAGAVDGHPSRAIESRGAARAVGASAVSRQARQRRHHAAGRDLPDRVIEGVGDIHVARAVDGGALRNAESRGVARAVGAPKRLPASPANVVTTPAGVIARMV